MTPHEKQVMMFSATLSKEIRPVCRKFMQDVIKSLLPSLSTWLAGQPPSIPIQGRSRGPELRTPPLSTVPWAAPLLPIACPHSPKALVGHTPSGRSFG